MCPLSRWSLFMTVLWFVYCETIQDNYVQIDLRDGRVSGYSPYISFVEPPRPGRPGTCSQQVVLKIDFSSKYHGAKLFLDYNEPPRLWTLDISDSPTGDGYGGDNGTTSNMAETQIHNKQLRVYGNLLPGHMDASSNGGLLITTVDDFVKKGSRTKIDISDERIEWKSGKHKDFIESKFLYTLSGQQPTYGLLDYNVYIGLNRVVAGNFRSGSGLCRVSISLYSLPGNACEKGTHSCHEDAICINTRRKYRCRCKPGYYGTGKICVDEDECSYENGGCVHYCQNTLGNYTCSCKEGFVLARNGHNCIDKNECLENLGGCRHQCANSLGGYECKCNQGWSLGTDGLSCQYGTWCQENLGCEHFCHTPEGRLICGCRQGYRLHPNGKNCIQTCAAGNGGCQHNCTDTPSGPICSCAPKYLLRDDNKTCIASCEVNNGGCDRKCIDGKDGPSCSCPRGFKLHQDGRTCLDQNECFENNGGCSHGCVNNIGSYECVCPKGYKVQINEKTCVDVDECELNTTCDHNCVNTPGSFYCACRTGYQLYGVTHCADKDECSVNNGGCQYRCQNTHGGFRCHCPNGQKLHTNKKDCIDSTACQPLPTPAKSSLACSFQGGNQVCTLSCDANSYPTLSQREYTYTCGASTGFEWSYNLQNSSLPSCSASIQAPHVKRTAKFMFTAVRCRTKRRIREELRRNITDQLNEQKKFKCRRSCNINFVNIDCTQNPKYKRYTKGTNHAVVSAEIELEIAPLPPKRNCDIACTKKRTERRMKKTLKKMRKSVNKQEFVIRYDKQERTIIKRTFKFKKRQDYACPEGSVYVTGKCVACSIGSFYKRKSGICVPCPRGTYQNQEGQMSCTKCPQNLPGVGITGAKDINECSVMCEPGTFSRQGLKPCQSCAVGTYQPDFGRTSCVPCGGGLTTHVLGARSFQECLANVTCSAGYFYNVQSHTCNPCPKGTYQPEPGLNYCVACPGTTSTDFTATTNQTECKDMVCGGHIGKLQGYIESPNYPGNYPNNVECIWKIKPGRKRRVLVIIPEIFIAKEDNCGDMLVLRKSKKPTSLTTYETCEGSERPIAFTSSTKRMWVQFKSDTENSASGFSIPFVTYNEEYQPLIEDIVRDGRLYSSYQHQSILKDRKLLNALMEVIAQPRNYFKYANVSRTMMPASFIRLLTSKVRKFFTT